MAVAAVAGIRETWSRRLYSVKLPIARMTSIVELPMYVRRWLQMVESPISNIEDRTYVSEDSRP